MFIAHATFFLNIFELPLVGSRETELMYTEGQLYLLSSSLQTEFASVWLKVVSFFCGT